MLIKENKNKQRIDMVVVLVFGYTEFVENKNKINITEESISNFIAGRNNY